MHKLLTRLLLILSGAMVMVTLAGARDLSAGLPPDPAQTAATFSLGFGLDSGGAVLHQAAALARVRTLAPNWVRAAVYWSALEPTDRSPSNYDWSQSEADLRPIINAGLAPVVYVARNPAWASTRECGPIDTTNSALLADFGEMMGAVASHYSQVPLWILYNEADYALPNNSAIDGCFGAGDLNSNGVPDTQEYAVMAGAASTAVHGANSKARLALSVAFDNFESASCPPGYPGLCKTGSFNYHFLSEVFAFIASHPRAGNEPYADAIAFNYYDIYGGFWQRQVGKSYLGIQAKAQFIRLLLQQANVTMDLLVTETGESSLKSWVGKTGQSQCLVVLLVRGVAAGLQGVEWWTLADVPANNLYYGILDASSKPKPSYAAYRTLLKQLTGFQFQKKLKDGKVEVYQFQKVPVQKLVVWPRVVSKAAKTHCADAHPQVKYTVKKVKKLGIVSMSGKKRVVLDNQTGDSNSQAGIIETLVDSTPSFIQLYH